MMVSNNNQALIHCKLESETLLQSLGLKYQLNDGELDVIVDDNDIIDDEEFVTSYGIDYALVNCIEAV